MRNMFLRSVNQYDKEHQQNTVELADYTVFVTGLPNDQSETLVEEGLRQCDLPLRRFESFLIHPRNYTCR